MKRTLIPLLLIPLLLILVTTLIGCGKEGNPQGASVSAWAVRTAVAPVGDTVPSNLQNVNRKFSFENPLSQMENYEAL